MTEAVDTSLEYITDKSGSKKVNAQRQNLKDLGNFAKEVGLKKNLDTAEIKGINYIKPNYNGMGWVAKSKDYVCVMHFNKNLRVNGQQIKEVHIDKAFQDFQFEKFRQNNTHSMHNFPSQVENIKPDMTFKEKTKNGLDYSNFTRHPGANIE